MAVRRPSPPRERTIPARRQRGARGHQRGQGRRPVQSEPPHEPPSVGAARLTAGRGRVVLVLPDLSRCEGSRVPTPGECLACSSRLGQPTPCRGWPSQLCLTACYHLSIYLRLLYLHVSINKRVIPALLFPVYFFRNQRAGFGQGQKS
jgi:hypothetical protein